MPEHFDNQWVTKQVIVQIDFIRPDIPWCQKPGLWGHETILSVPSGTWQCSYSIKEKMIKFSFSIQPPRFLQTVSRSYFPAESRWAYISCWTSSVWCHIRPLSFLVYQDGSWCSYVYPTNQVCSIWEGKWMISCYVLCLIRSQII